MKLTAYIFCLSVLSSIAIPASALSAAGQNRVTYRMAAQRARYIELQVGQALAHKFSATLTTVMLHDGYFADQIRNLVTDFTGNAHYIVDAAFVKHGSRFWVACPVTLSGVRPWSGSENTEVLVENRSCRWEGLTIRTPNVVKIELAALAAEPSWSAPLGLALEIDSVTAKGSSDPAILYHELQVGQKLKQAFAAESVEVQFQDEVYADRSNLDTSSMGEISASLKINGFTYGVACAFESDNHSLEVFVQDTLKVKMPCDVKAKDGGPALSQRDGNLFIELSAL